MLRKCRILRIQQVYSDGYPDRTTSISFASPLYRIHFHDTQARPQRIYTQDLFLSKEPFFQQRFSVNNNLLLLIKCLLTDTINIVSTFIFIVVMIFSNQINREQIDYIFPVWSSRPFRVTPHKKNNFSKKSKCI